ncbi:MAG: iron-sulfur cluster insertion protein ErpA [Parvularculaceae bacterium]
MDEMSARANVTVSDRAAAKIAKILADEPEGALLRIAVLGGGCSGFQYSFDIVSGRQEDDLLIERDGARIVLDPLSVEYMAGAEIDYTDELIGAAFKINNPLATASCGCGTSFSI